MNTNVFTQKQVKQINKTIKVCTLYGKTFCDYFDKAYRSNVVSYAFKSYCKALQIYLDTMKSAVWNYNSKTLSNKNLYKWFLLQNKQSVFEIFKDKEEELDTFFDTIYNHTNCNGCTYEDNLRFWNDSSLQDVKTQCSRSYSEIPWQYVLRNPLLKNEKYLAAIGKGAYLSKYSNYFKFFKIETYQELTDEQIKVIIDNMEYQKMNKSDEIDRFLLKHLDLISDENFLDKIYDRFKDNYSFEVYDCVLHVPYKYAYKWLTEHKNKAIQFLDKYPEHFTLEQRKEIITKIFDL